MPQIGFTTEMSTGAGRSGNPARKNLKLNRRGRIFFYLLGGAGRRLKKVLRGEAGRGTDCVSRAEWGRARPLDLTPARAGGTDFATGAAGASKNFDGPGQGLGIF